MVLSDVYVYGRGVGGGDVGRKREGGTVCDAGGGGGGVGTVGETWRQWNGWGDVK